MLSKKKLQLKKLLENEPGAIKRKKEGEEPFHFAFGGSGMTFYDMKLASLNPEILNLMMDAMMRDDDILNIIRTDYGDERPCLLNFNRIGALAVGGIPLATLLSYNISTPMIIVRSTKFDLENPSPIHETGTKKNVIGDCKGMSVLLIDDVATTGGSIISAVRNIRNEGGMCNVCIVILDREEGAREACEKYDIKVVSLLKASEL